jgi:DNA mismatch endonuclease (patch repair protein)
MGKAPQPVDEARRYTMSRIKSKDTSIEVRLRKALWASGVHYRKNYSMLPGIPDVAIPNCRIAIFCDGEFWHGKDWDPLAPKIQNNRDFWIAKIERNISRDRKVERDLREMDWTVLRYWGADIVKDLPRCVEEIECAMLHDRMEAWATDWGYGDL